MLELERNALLEASSEALHSSLERERILGALVHLVVPRFAALAAARAMGAKFPEAEAIPDGVDRELANTLLVVCWPRSDEITPAALFEDLETAPAWAPFARELAMGSMIAVPIGESVELLLFRRRDQAAFDESDLAFAETLASRALLPLANAEVHRKLEEMNRELRAKNTFYEQIVRRMPAAVAIADAATGMVTSMNDEAKRMLMSPLTPEAVSQLARDLKGRPLGKDAWPISRVASTGRSVRDEELQWMRPDGTELPLLVSSVPIYDERGTIASAATVFQDITERKRLQREREARLGRDAHLKDDFLSILAHELRNPLTPAIIALEVMRERDKIDTKERRIIERQVHRVRKIVEDLLEAAHLMMNRIELEKQPVDLVELLKVAIDSNRAAISDNGLVLEVDLPKDPIFVDGDPRRLTRVFENVLDNAAKFTPRRGKISVSASEKDGVVDVAVRDTGVGIRRELLAHVFELFSRDMRNAAPSGSAGLGAGLAIVQRIVELHGGSVAASSAGPGRGAEIRLRFSTIERTPEAVASVEGTRGVSDRRVLVVDDNRDAARMLASLLQTWGCDVTVAYDGFTALALERERELDVVLLDIALPGMSGYAVAEALRARSPATTIIAVSGYSEADAGRSRAAGCDAHVVKPIEPRRLRELLMETSR